VYSDSVTIFNLTTETEENHMTITCRVLRTVAFIISSAFLCAPKAHAVDRVVSTCDEAHFLAALKGGLSFFDSVSVTFSCAGIITLTHAVSIVIPTSIDGGGMVTLTGLEAGLYSDCKSGSVTCYGALDLSNITMQGFTGYALQNQSSNAFHVSNTTFVNNRANPASGLGGAIASGGPLYVHNCYFFLNSAFSGGAIVNYFDGSLVVGESTFFLNNIGTNGLGGAIYSEGVSMYIYNSTFTDNGSFTGAAAGNIYFDGSNGTGLSVINNSTLSGGRSSPGRAGNLFVGTTSQESLPLIVTNTIMANPATPYNCEGPMINGGGNLQWPASSAPCVGAVADPKLGLLANNGGTTMTMALMPGSAAIDKGLDPQCAATDQRHVLRPQGAHCDIGAYEAIPNVTGAVAVLVSVVNQQFRSSLPKTGQNRLTQQVLAPLSSSLVSSTAVLRIHLSEIITRQAVREPVE